MRLRGDAAPDSSDIRAKAFQTASSALNWGASSLELEAPLRAYVNDIPESVASIIGQREELVGPPGRLEPIGVLAGMVIAMVTRASYVARLKWFRALDWWEVSRMLRGLAPSFKEAKALFKGRIGSDGHVDKDAFERVRGLIPVQPGENYRAWGVNSFAVLPTWPSSVGAARECRRVKEEVRTPAFGRPRPTLMPRSLFQASRRMKKMRQRAVESQKERRNLGFRALEAFRRLRFQSSRRPSVGRQRDRVRRQVCVGSRVPPLCIPRWSTERAGGLVCS